MAVAYRNKDEHISRAVGSAINQIGASVTDQAVAARIGIKCIQAGSPQQAVISGPAPDDVGIRAAVDGIISSAACDRIAPSRTAKRIIAIARSDDVVSGGSGEAECNARGIGPAKLGKGQHIAPPAGKRRQTDAAKLAIPRPIIADDIENGTDEGIAVLCQRDVIQIGPCDLHAGMNLADQLPHMADRLPGCQGQGCIAIGLATGAKGLGEGAEIPIAQGG